METLVELDDINALIKHCEKLLEPYNLHLDVKELSVDPYSMGGDDRIGWKEVYIVTLDGYGVLGFTDEAC